MPLTILVGQTSVATAAEVDAAGVNVPVIPANLTWTGSEATVATVTGNPDGTASVVAVGPGTITVTVTDTVFNLTTSDTVTVTAPSDPPVSIAISFGTPA